MTTDDPNARPEPQPGPAPDAAPAEGAPPRWSPDAGEPDPADLAIAFTPRQILGGFALLAALVMLMRRRNRGPNRGRGSERD